MKYPRHLLTAALPSLVLVLTLGVVTAAQGAQGLGISYYYKWW